MKRLEFTIDMLFRDDWRSDVQMQKSNKTMMYSCGVFSAICLVMCIMNIVKRSRAMIITTGLMCALFLVMCLVTRSMGAELRSTGTPIRVVCVLVIIAIFTYYIITGGQNGFSPMWLIIIPIAGALIFGFVSGLLISGYFLIFITLTFWTPLIRLLQYDYPPTFLERFPLAYLCSAVFSVLTSYIICRFEYVEAKRMTMLDETVREERERLALLSIKSIEAISETIDAKDPYTKQHSRRVASYSGELARRMGWSEKRVDNLCHAAMLHDIGKIGIPDEILNGSSRLNCDEYELMKTHTTAGAEILRDLTVIDKVAEGAYYHHERYDGGGYPTGLAGEDIPIEARIISVADAVDAMFSKRSYHDAFSEDAVRREVEKGSGSQFDPYIASIMLGMIDDGCLIGRVLDAVNY